MNQILDKLRESRRRAQRKFKATPKGKRANALFARRRYSQLHVAVLMFLGVKCHCGFNDMRALQIDHIHGGGRREMAMRGPIARLQKVLKQPQDYQVLCANCNWIKKSERGESVPRKHI